MKDKFLVIVDMQHDFIDGSLGTKEAVKIIPNVVQKIHDFKGEVRYTEDTHEKDYLETLEGRHLPVEHCIEGTFGVSLYDDIRWELRRTGFRGYPKKTFGSKELAAHLQSEYELGKLDSIEVVGLCTDICVISNVLLFRAFMPEVEITVDASCCAGVTPEKHEAALDVMESCLINVINRGKEPWKKNI